MTLDDYMQDLDKALKHLPADERDAALDEIRSHLQQQVDELIEAGTEPAKAEALACAQFGDPAEIAAGYEGSQRRDAEVVARVAKAVAKNTAPAAAAAGRVAGKGISGLAKIIAAICITAIIVAGVVAVVGIAMADDWGPWISDKIEANAATEVYRRDMTNIGERSDPFYVPDDVRRVEIAANVWQGPACIMFTVHDPNGTSVFDSGRLCEDDDVRTTLPPMTGSWRITFAEGGQLEGDVVVRYYKG